MTDCNIFIYCNSYCKLRDLGLTEETILHHRSSFSAASLVHSACARHICHSYFKIICFGRGYWHEDSKDAQKSSDGARFVNGIISCNFMSPTKRKVIFSTSSECFYKKIL